MLDLDAISGREPHDLLHHVLELADVAGPAVPLEQLERSSPKSSRPVRCG